MNDKIAICLGVIALVTIPVLIGFGAGRKSTEVEYQKAAINRGYAEWTVSSEGVVEFKWKEPVKP